MRKTISMLMVLVFGASLWANQNVQKSKSENQRPKILSEKRHSISNTSRTESYTLYMEDSWGDGWNGASLDLSVNGVVVASGLTISSTDNGGDWNEYAFSVEIGDVVATTWTAGSYDPECSYGFYDTAGDLVAEAGTGSQPLLEVSFTVSPPAIGVWFSEYAEGSSNNKYLEIYNGTDAAVDLTGLAFPNVSNAPTVAGEYEYWNTFPAGASVAPGDVYVIAHGSADAAILAEADHTFTYLSNGDDGFCLVVGVEGNYTILDCIGDWNGDPGAGWEVAGVADATKDHTLQRKAGLTSGNLGDWATSAGTDADNSEWIVLENEDWTGLGSHNNDLPCADNEYVVTLEGGSFASEISWEILDAAGTVVASGGGVNISVADMVTVCLDNDGTNGYTLNMIDSWGDGWNGNVFTLWTAADSDGDGVMEYTEYFSATLTTGTGGTAYIPGLGDVFGCTDSGANNYDPNATVDDGSCVTTCDANEYVVTLDGGSFANEISWNIVDGSDNVVLSGGAPITVADGVTACLNNDGTEQYTLNMIDSWGDGWNGFVFTLWTAADSDGDGVMEYTEYFSATLSTGTEGSAMIPGTNDVPGCMDETALNYDPAATLSDGSCYYTGEVCEAPFDFVSVGGALDGSASATGTLGPGEEFYFAFTMDQAWENLSISLEGSTFDTKLDLYDPGCGTLQASNDDNGAGGLWSLIMLEDVSAGSHVVKVYGYSSSSTGDYVLTINAYQDPVTITDLAASGGINRVYLQWSPLNPALSSAMVANNNGSQFSSIEEQIQWDYDNKKEPINEANSWIAKTRDQLMAEIVENGQVTRDTEVLVTLFDSYGDGHDSDVWIKDQDGNILYTLAGGWTGTEAAFGPFTLADGSYDLEWDPTGTWLSEQTAEITLVSDGSVVGAGAATVFCFSLGEGVTCPQPDITVTSVDYDPMSGLAHATVANIGAADVTTNFWALGFLAEPDVTDPYPAAYFCFGSVPPLPAGESVEVILSGGSSLPELVGYDDGNYTIYVHADGFGQLVAESDETNNVGMIDVVNSNPLANSSFNVWRDYVEGGTNEPIANLTGANYVPGTLMEYIDADVTAGTEYCYLVTQVDGTSESGVSNLACATPSAPPVVPGPTDLTGSASGFNVSLSWTAPATTEGAIGEGLGTPSSTRQGGDDMTTATVITELTQLTGTNVGYFDDYDEDCGSGTSTSGDVVYKFTPSEDMAVDLTTCYSDYDTKIFVYENAPENLASTVTGGPASACSDDDDWPGATDCTPWTSYIAGLYMEAGNDYYIILDGWNGSEGNYVLDFIPYDTFQGYTIWNLTGTDVYTPIGQAGPTDTEWSTVLYASEPTDMQLAVTATYLIPGIVDPVTSDPAGPVAITLALEDNPNNLTAMGQGDDVHLMWEPPIDASQMELSYHDGMMVNASWYGGAVAVRYRVSGTYAINALANSVWTGGWPDDILGETPFTLSILALDPETDLPGEVLYSEEVLVDADPLSDYYGWAMTSALADDPLVVTGDVFVKYSDFGYDWANSTAGPDMDMMGCDAVLDFPGNRYNYLGQDGAGEWQLDVNSGAFSFCGDWILEMHADFTAGNGVAVAGNNGLWIDQSGSPSVNNLPSVYAEVEAASTKENPVTLDNPPVSNPVFASQTLDRDMLHYNIYRDGVVVGDQAPGVHQYMDAGLDWGTYTYHVTAMYDDHESIATNMVEVTLSNVPPNAVMLISPGDGLEVEVNQDNLEETVAFIWTAAIDEDNDPVEYILYASGLLNGEEIENFHPSSMMYNGGFEDGMEGWLIWPEGQGSNSIESTGNGIFGSEDTFEAYEGVNSLKMWGQYGDTYPNETSIYQGYNVEGAGLSAGDHVSASGAMMSHADDWIGQGANSAYLFISFFDEGWNMIQSTLGPLMDGSRTASEWHEFDVRAEVPAGAVNMNVGVAYYQVSGNDHGSVYFDEVNWYSPQMTTGLFLPYEDVAMDAYEAGVTDITWEWDVWSFDGFELTPSQSGPRQLHVNVANLLGIENASLPKEFALHNNYPNPFNPVTNITYDIPEATDVTLEIYNVMGQRVRTLAQGNHEPGRYQIVWSATNDIGQALSSGMYIYRIQAGDFVSVKKLVLMK